MASDFIYILSSLPMLSFEGEGAVDYKDFLETCKSLVTPKEYKKLCELSLRTKSDKDDGLSVLKVWDHWGTAMNEVIALWRAHRRKTDAALYLHPVREAYPNDVRRLEAILQMKGIHEKQDAWELLQWNRLEELADAEYFNFSALIVYALKLLLLEDRRKRTAETGKAAFEAMVSKRLDEAAANRISVEE